MTDPRQSPVPDQTTLEREHCVICGSSGFKYLFNVGAYPTVLCPECNLQCLNPQPSDQRLSEIYSNNYVVPCDAGEVEYLKRQTAALYIKRLRKALPQKDCLRLLEIGCGLGNLLLEAKAQGFDVTGIEYAQNFVESANRKLGEERVFSGQIHDFNFCDRKFDAIVASDVIEHVRDPKLFVEHVVSWLKPGGVFYCTTPSLGSWSAKLMGRSWVEYKEEHLYYFAPTNFSRLLKEGGFKEITIESNVKLLNMNYIIAHFEKFPVAGWSQLLKMVRRMSPAFALKKPFQLEASGMTAIAQI